MSEVIHNRWLPFKGFTAINLFGLVFVREGTRMNPVLMNHERIHTVQQKEMLYICFYLWYLAEWLVHLIRQHDRMKAYRAISFEREAYLHEREIGYIQQRRHYAWLKYLK